MKTHILIAALLFVGFLATAQDNIVFTDGTEVKAKVSEISTNEVVYTRHDNPQGPTYRVERNKVFMVQFENGTSEVVSPLNFNQVPNDRNAPRQLMGGSYKSPGLAFLFSALMPGGGQYYNRQFAKGGVMNGLWLAGIITSATANNRYRYDTQDCYFDANGNYTCDYNTFPTYTSEDVQYTIGQVAVWGTWLWSVIDAPVSAARINRRNDANGISSMLHFNVGKEASLSLHPFRSQGLGGSLAVRF